MKTLLQNCWEDRKHIAGLSGNFSTTLKLLKPLTLAAFSALSTYQIIQKMKSFLRSDITFLKRFNEMKTHFLKKKNPRDSSFRHFGISSLCGLTNTSDDEIIKRQRIISQKIIIIQNEDASVVLWAAPFSEIESHNCLLNNKVASAPNQNANFKTKQYFSNRRISQKFLRYS